MKTINNQLRDDMLPQPSSRDLRGRQSVRATFKLTARAIETMSAVSIHLGIKQKSLFDHLVDDIKALEVIAREVQTTKFDEPSRVQKTFVLSRRTLNSLELASVNFQTSRDALVEYSIQRLMPVITKEKEKHQKRKALLRRILSSAFETDVNLPFITADANGPKHLNLKITRTKLENLVSDLLDKLEGPCRMALKDAGLAASDIDEVVLVGGMTRMPAVQERVQRIFGKMPNKGVNPDEVVALGAAIQGAVLKGDVKDVLLLDVTPLSLGIETLGGVMTKLIERNTTIPARKSEIFTTAEDNQPAVSIHVLQGEREMAIDNKTLGRFELTGIAPAARGVPQIEVAFDIDANGIVEVSATNKATGKAQSIKITHSSGLSREDIDRLVKEAELHTEEDQHKRDRVEARNTADALIHATEKSLVELGGKTGAEDRSRVEEAIANLKRAMDGTDTGDIKRLTEELRHASQRLAEGVYQQSTAAGTGQDRTTEGSSSQANPSASNRDEEVVEAEYEEVN